MKTTYSSEKPYIYLIGLISLLLLISIYTLVRYGGSWADSDTATISTVINAILGSSKLVPARNVYANGYGYQTLAMAVIHITGISLSDFQATLSILLAIWIVVPAWLAYRELLRSEIAASLATLILIIQPEFLFPLLRGTHEKFTRGLMFICLFLLFRSMRTKTPRQLAPLIICFYLSAYAMISFNTFLATSFILAIIIALVFHWVSNRAFTKSQETNQPDVSKLLYVTTILLVIAFLFTFYAYPPAKQQIYVLQSVWDQLALLFLPVEETPTSVNPYLVVYAGWINLPIYFLVSLANWLLLGITIPLWIKQTITWFVKRSEKPKDHEISLWAFYAAFASLGGISVLIDISGAIAANLQHRMFPSFAMIGAPLASLWLTKQNPSSKNRYRISQIATGLVLGTIMILAVLKATNEPLLSNYWLFTTPAERSSLEWAEEKLDGRSIWTGLDGRITNGYIINLAQTPTNIRLDPYLVQDETKYFLISRLNIFFTLRINGLLPTQSDDLITYDNGESQIYHRRPNWPFQK